MVPVDSQVSNLIVLNYQDLMYTGIVAGQPPSPWWSTDPSLTTEFALKEELWNVQIEPDEDSRTRSLFSWTTDDNLSLQKKKNWKGEEKNKDLSVYLSVCYKNLKIKIG